MKPGWEFNTPGLSYEYSYVKQTLMLSKSLVQAHLWQPGPRSVYVIMPTHCQGVDMIEYTDLGPGYIYGSYCNLSNSSFDSHHQSWYYYCYVLTCLACKMQRSSFKMATWSMNAYLKQVHHHNKSIFDKHFSFYFLNIKPFPVGQS